MIILFIRKKFNSFKTSTLKIFIFDSQSYFIFDLFHCRRRHVVVMFFASLKNKQIFKNLKNCMLRLNKHVDRENYVFVLHRIKKLKLKKKLKFWIVCDRDRKFKKSQEQKRRHIVNKWIDCLFSMIVKRFNNNINSWFIDVVDSKHNHKAFLTKTHSMLKRITLTKMKIDITK
jgi:hypothetical protein